MKNILQIVLIVILAAGIIFICPIACTRPDDARRVLMAQGYKQVEITGWRPLMAGKEDAFSTGFRAQSIDRSIVTGAVTSGWFKGNTVRID